MKALDIFKHYWKATRSLSFISRFILVNIYARIPFKKVREFLIERSNHTYYFITPFGEFIARSTFGWYVLGTYYENDVRKFIDKNIKEFSKDKNKILIDVGAHIGRYVVELSKNYNYSVIAFEPYPETFRTLKINTVLSGVEDSVELFNYGLGSKEEQVFFEHWSGGEGSDHVIDDSSTKSNSKTKILKVPIKRFDDISTRFGKDLSKNVRLVIIDVEGAEYDVLQGMRNTLKNCAKVDVIVEIFSNNPNIKKTFELMKELNFEKPIKINKDNWYFKKRQNHTTGNKK